MSGIKRHIFLQICELVKALLTNKLKSQLARVHDSADDYIPLHKAETVYSFLYFVRPPTVLSVC